MDRLKKYNVFLESRIQKKIGIDIHGVINTNPHVFSILTKELKNRGYEIHILTGPRLNHPYKTKKGIFNSVKDELKLYGITYDHLFSVLDYNIENNSNVWKNEKGWWTDEESWNSTKSKYCIDKNLDLHIDDTNIYGKYFKTPFAHLTPYIDENSPRILELHGLNTDNEVVQLINKISDNKIISKKID